MYLNAEKEFIIVLTYIYYIQVFKEFHKGNFYEIIIKKINQQFKNSPVIIALFIIVLQCTALKMCKDVFHQVSFE